MDADRFDSLIRNLGAGASRRRLLGSLLGAALLGLRHGPESVAKRKPKRRKAAHKDKTKHDKHQQQRRRKNAKRTPEGAQTEAVSDACKRLCELVFPPGQKRERCLQRAVEHQDLCECVNFCRRVYPRDLRRQLACLKAAAEGDEDGLCVHCGADPERHCAGACCAEPGQCANGHCADTQDPCAGVDCDDDNACTADSCDSMTGCIHEPIDCDDGDPCTTDTCHPASGCQHTSIADCCRSDADCDDDNACTTDTCDTDTHTCVHDDVVCDDDNACTLDSCDPQVGCVHTENPDCDECRSDADCDDGNRCTIDTCEQGRCVHTPVVCDDRVDCTFDECRPDVGCVFTPRDDFCESEDPCLTPRCTPGGCIHEPLDCDDGNPCTIDTCVAGVCQHRADNSICDDGLRCTDDVCVPDADDPRGYLCEWIVDLSNCGHVATCQEAQCSVGNDCIVLSFDDRCPQPTVSCLAPKCTNAGCSFQDICSPANPQCNGCAQCSCSLVANKCVPSCPA